MKTKNLIALTLLVLVIISAGYSIFYKQKTKARLFSNTTTSNNIVVSPSSSLPIKEAQEQDIKSWTDTIYTGGIIDGFVEHPNMIKIDKYDKKDWCRRYIAEVSVDKTYILINGIETKLSYDDIKKWPGNKYINFTLYYYIDVPKTQSNILKTIVNWFSPEVEASCKYDYIVSNNDVQKIVFDFNIN